MQPPALASAYCRLTAISDCFECLDALTGSEDELVLRSPVVKEVPPSFYRPDYRADFEMGDDPRRHYNW